ncbi:MAG: nickel-type superoxide dismutase maturation protease [Cyanobacteria bacterium P01_F01_bin.42]
MTIAAISWREFALWILRRRKRVRVTNRSMLPTLKPGDEVLYQPLTRTLLPGDIVIINHPQQPHLKLIKRILSLEATNRLDLRGDNAEESTDSRHFGLVSRSQVVGKVTCLFSSSGPPDHKQTTRG